MDHKPVTPLTLLEVVALYEGLAELTEAGQLGVRGQHSTQVLGQGEGEVRREGIRVNIPG